MKIPLKVAACRQCPNPAKAKGLCGTCHEYERKYGRRRPPHLCARQTELNRRRHERERSVA